MGLGSLEAGTQSLGDQFGGPVRLNQCMMCSCRTNVSFELLKAFMNVETSAQRIVAIASISINSGTNGRFPY